MVNLHTAVRRALLLSFGLSLVSSTCGMPSALAVSMPGLSKKSASFDLPTAEKLDEASDTASDATPDAKSNPELAPMTLTETKPEPANQPETVKTETGENVLNATVTTNTFVPKGPLEGDNSALLAPTSVKGSKVKNIGSLGGNLLDQAKSINAAPLPLIESSADAERKADETLEIERDQLTSLWEATLTRSPDINFVLQKLMPSSDPSKVTTVMMKTLSTALFGGLGVVPMLSPTPGGYLVQSAGYSTIQQLLNLTDSNASKKAKITQTEQIMLYNMIRTTADKLVDKYRSYKTKHHVLYKANSDFEDLKNVAQEAKKDAAKSIEIEYTLRKQQRDIDEIGRDLSKCRQDLVDLAGQEAVAKLDQTIDEEFKKLHPELIPTTPSTPANEMLAGGTGEGSETKQNKEEKPNGGSLLSAPNNFKLPI